MSPIDESKTHYVMETYDANDRLVSYTNASGDEQNFRYAFIEPNTNPDGIFKSKIYVYLDDYQNILDEGGEVVVKEEDKPEGYLATLLNGKDFYNPPGSNGNEIKIITSPAQHDDNDGVLRDGLQYQILTRQIGSVDGAWEPMIEFFVPDGLPASNLDVKHRYITREYDVNGHLINYKNSTNEDPTIRKIIGNTYSVSSKPKATYALNKINGLAEGEFKPREDKKVEFIYGRQRQQGQVDDYEFVYEKEITVNQSTPITPTTPTAPEDPSNQPGTETPEDPTGTSEEGPNQPATGQPQEDLPVDHQPEEVGEVKVGRDIEILDPIDVTDPGDVANPVLQDGEDVTDQVKGEPLQLPKTGWSQRLLPFLSQVLVLAGLPLSRKRKK